eukprot:TRINITY_DN29862_c0_g1_i1.p1 TRINITY_DN29862_c0_g1~~TRINITY_DN29862_c0_g1_i1.p1  ORF type:complete len:278 (-),score=49.68 TRINITY_DN29862_c0_g1_i1:162-995(-)
MAKPRWADLVDSSQETAREEDSRHDAMRNLLRDDSYGGEADPEFESSQKGLNSRLAANVSLNSGAKEVVHTGPKDFSFLFDNPTTSASSNEAVPACRRRSSAAAGSQCGAPTHDAISNSAEGDARQKRRQPAATQVGHAPIGKRAKANRLASLKENSATTTTDAELRASPQESSMPESQPSAAVENQSEVSSEDWQHREEKRRKALVIVKATPEYQFWSAQVDQNPQLRCAAGTPAPRTPDASDRAVSKRRWEQEVQSWRAALKQWCEKHPPASSPT